MADGALFIGWGRAVPGREQQALQVFDEATRYYGRLQQEGEIEGFEAFALEPHGGDLQGFLLLRGDPAKLARVRAGEEFRRLVRRSDLAVERLGVVEAVTGEALARMSGEWGQEAGALGR